MIPVSSTLRTIVTLLVIGTIGAAVWYYNRPSASRTAIAAPATNEWWKKEHPLIAAVTHPAQLVSRPSPKASPSPCTVCQARLERYRDAILSPRTIFPQNTLVLSHER